MKPLPLTCSFQVRLGRTARRVLVVLQVLTGLAVLSYWNAQPAELALTPATQFTVAASVLVHILLLLYLGTARLSSRLETPFRTRERLDERQLKLPHRAYYLSYLLFGLWVVAYLVFSPSSSVGPARQVVAVDSRYSGLLTALSAWLEPAPVRCEARP